MRLRKVKNLSWKSSRTTCTTAFDHLLSTHLFWQIMQVQQPSFRCVNHRRFTSEYTTVNTNIVPILLQGLSSISYMHLLFSRSNDKFGLMINFYCSALDCSLIEACLRGKLDKNPRYTSVQYYKGWGDGSWIILVTTWMCSISKEAKVVMKLWN